MADEQTINRLRLLAHYGEQAHKKRIKGYDNSYDVYRASRPVTGGDPWQSKLRVKYGRQVIDTAMVNIVTGEPRCIVKPRTPEDELGAKGMQGALDYYVREDHLVERRQVIAQQGLILGVTAAKNHWLYQTTTRPQKRYATDPFTGAQVQSTTNERLVLRDGPSLEPLNVYYTFWDPNATDVDDCDYICCDYWVTPDHLRSNEHDADKGFGLYHNLKEVFEAGDRGAAKPETTAQAIFLGGDDEKRKGMVHLRETWWRNGADIWISVVANGATLVRHEQSPYWHGKFPIVIAQVMPDLFEMQGIPDTEAVEDIQNALWTLQNMAVDNMHLTTMRGVTYREGGVTDPNNLVLKPRFKWAVVDHDDIRAFEVQQLGSDVFTERQRLLSDLQLVTGVNPYVSGSDNSANNQNTATGITALQEVASRLLRFKAGQLHYKIYQRSYEQWGDNIQQFMDKSVWVKVNGEKGNEEWREVSPDQVVGHFDYTLEGSEQALTKQQERGDAVQLLNAFAPLAQLGIINFKPLVERVGEAYGIANPESLLAPPQQPSPAAPFGQQPGQGPQQGPPLMGGQQMPQPVQQAIMQGS